MRHMRLSLRTPVDVSHQVTRRISSCWIAISCVFPWRRYWAPRCSRPSWTERSLMGVFKCIGKMYKKLSFSKFRLFFELCQAQKAYEVKKLILSHAPPITHFSIIALSPLQLLFLPPLSQ